jgi:hypothetical protein
MRGTAGSGSNVYRGGRLPAELIGDYFHGEVVGRVVRRIHPAKVEGLTKLSSVYAPERLEFIRSTDPLFRPVEGASIAPRGAPLAGRTAAPLTSPAATPATPPASSDHRAAPPVA